MAVDLEAARANLAQQVASGGIQQWQMDAELNRLAQLNAQEPAPAPPPAPPPPPAPNGTPTVGPQGTPQQGVDLNQAQRDLQAQVATGAISQAQMDGELNRLRGLSGGVGINDVVARARSDLQKQVDSGGITEQQRDAELNRLAQAEAMKGLQSQVDSGAISMEQAQAEANRLAGIALTNAAPAVNPPGVRNYDLSTPQGSVEAQATANQYTTNLQQQYNRPNEVGPYGSATYSQNPDGTITRRYDLSQNQGAINAYREDADLKLADAARSSLVSNLGQYSQPFSYSGIGPQPQTLSYANAPEGPQGRGIFQDLGANPTSADFSAERTRIEDELYGRYEQKIAPRFEQERVKLEQQLADQGIPRESELWTRSMDQMKERQNDAYQEARAQAVSQAGSEQARLYGMSADSRGRTTQERVTEYGLTDADRARYTQEQQDLYNYGDTSRQRAIEEYQTQRAAPLQELGAMYGLQRGVVQPNYSPIQSLGIQPLDVSGTGLAYGQLQQNYDIASMQDATQRYIAGLKGAEGGGEEGPDFFAKLNAQTQAEKDLAAFKAGLSAPPSSGGGKSPAGTAATSIGTSAAGGFAGAFGKGLGNSLAGGSK